jgi:PST family polysaccharide transporter
MLLSDNEKTIGFALKSFSWNTAGNFTRSIAGFVINIVLARLLGPEPFGVVALALLIIGIGNLVIESGLGSALVQQKEIDRHDIAFVFTLQMAFGIGLAAIITVLSPWLAEQFAAPMATPVLQTMALILVLQAFAQVPSALLRRKLDFKHLQIAQITSFFIGYLGFGLPLAFAGFGVWSLVAAQVVQNGLNALMVFLFSRHSLALTLKGSRHLTRFGLRILAANIANWIIQYIDQAVIGRRFGAKNLGFYSRAFFLNWTPTGIILTSAQASLFSAVSRMGKGPETIRIFRGFMSAFAIFFFPIYWLIAMESTNIIKIIYGHEWMPAAALLKPLAVAMPFLALVGLEGPVLNGLGKPQYEMRAQWLTAFFAILVLISAATISLSATAWSILIIYIFRLTIMSFMTRRILEITWMQLMRPILSGLSMGVITILVWNLSDYLITAKTTDIQISFVRSIVVLFTWMLVFWIGRAWLFPEFSTLVNFLLFKKTNIVG